MSEVTERYQPRGYLHFEQELAKLFEVKDRALRPAGASIGNGPQVKLTNSQAPTGLERTDLERKIAPGLDDEGDEDNCDEEDDE